LDVPAGASGTGRLPLVALAPTATAPKGIADRGWTVVGRTNVCPDRRLAVIVEQCRAESVAMEAEWQNTDVAKVHPTDEAAGAATSWLCRGDFDRGRLLDMEERVRPARQKTFAILTLALVATGPWLGWWPLLCLIPGAGCFALADTLMPRVARPEYVMFAAWVASELVIAGAVSLNGGPVVPTLSWLAIPVITLSSRFSKRGVVAGVGISMALVLAVAFGVNAGAVEANPTLVIAPLALVLCVAMLTIPLMDSDIQHRNDAVIDQLTGLLNRKALSTRIPELVQQSQVTGEPVGLIVGDLDHFKEVNDRHGHTVGDAVLKDVTYMLRKQLRAFDLAYRLGGEEFLILLPGSGHDNAVELAERLREAVSADRVGGLYVTMSFGVDASRRGEAFDYDAVFAKADAALYEAKEGGRDQVRAADLEAIPEFV
jgi:diguanylate cyclase (GGDEF)-like protein